MSMMILLIVGEDDDEGCKGLGILGL